MGNQTGLMKRLQQVMPAGVRPKFTSAAELMTWQREEGRRHAEALIRENQRIRLENILGRSGILERYQACTFKNYQVENPGQRNALTMARAWLSNAESGHCACFVFSGSPGTGKNHLAAAICNTLLRRGRTALIITVADLMLGIRDGYSAGRSEGDLIERLCGADLLVLDEVGVQRDTRNEFVVLNQIIDRRAASMRPTGILTNLNFSALVEVLGPRAVDRLQDGNGLWVIFDWNSYRKNGTR
ncbi:ATP-binding protein [Shimwellia blattae]|uniref:Putative DNA replication factor encoded within prophage n=1 Tax=Shimwellia blattae (strain ATCC 29907 / DSM 4481 / JCM 1650 / NBRC 105725 / CDC 9005-74) TaxID=630626 RepID=I2B9H0_SHIBC|nr:ATP-binding protein [Shimwellia blattae]AFJ47174.1 putative DNA replication factor encoded within prophage [Shimwellia blattae DSM 4481 = NBRC 105725]GAB82294.1 DNA replication protein DnaC [Shimwellia blattae DSM 4481 = NBRC 105725]VDY64667.1 DNA replication protein dnaC [Shimwellia blattae]VEC22772.1 DNA replication protein dnaC [Shimwellia blattae]